MTRKLTFLLFLAFTFVSGLFSQSRTVILKGTDQGYAGVKLSFFRYTERVFDSFESLAEVKVDPSGNFSTSFDLGQTQCIYCQTPLYLAYLFAEPGKVYHISLPPLPEKKSENILNPYNIPPLWHLIPGEDTITGHPGLNAAINNFNREFEPFLDKQILRYYDPRQSSEKLDSFILASAKTGVPENKDYFESYLLYRLASLSFVTNQFSHADLYEKYLKDKPVRPDLPSWWEFFNLYFDGYFSSLTAKKEFTGLYSAIGSGNYSLLNGILRLDPALQNDQLREWVVLRELHTGYYANGLPLSTLRALCDSIQFTSKYPLNAAMARQLVAEASSLLPGMPPPSAVVFDISGDTLQLAGMRGKYSYIGFCSLDNIGCQKEFEYLKYFYHKYSKYLEILVILPESEKDKIESFTEENSIPWKFRYAPDRDKIYKDYKIRAFPEFYLLDKDGKIIMSPATLPSAGFEQQLFSIMKSKGDI